MPAPASGADDVSVVDAAGREVSAGWDELAAATSRLAVSLQRRGLCDGAVAVVAGSTAYETVLTILASWECGAAVCVVPAGTRHDPTRVALDVGRAVERLDARLVYAPATVHDPVRLRLGGAPASEVLLLDERGVAGAASGAAGRAVHPGIAGRLGSHPDGAVAIFQPTSGTTGRQRIVPVTWGMLRHNVTAIARRLGLTGRDSFASWMPLFHDMGLVLHLVAPALLGARLALVPPETYAAAPAAFPALVDRRRGTVAGTTSSGVALLERSLVDRRHPGGGLDLSCLRSLVCGAEMIDVELCERAVAAGETHGLRPDVFAFGYGMAEATLAVSLRRPGRPAEAEDAATLGGADDRAWARPTGRGFARTGPPVAGTAVRVVAVEGRWPLGEHEVGEIEVRGPSVMSAYVGRTPDASGIDAGGWLRTGDLGYWSAGEVAVVGRRDDVVVVGGLKVVPDDVERIVGAIPGVRPGRVAAVPVRGRAGEALGIVAERSDRTGGAAVDERAVRVAVRHELGVLPEAVTFVPRGTVPKTTSGKLRRAACRRLLARTDTQR